MSIVAAAVSAVMDALQSAPAVTAQVDRVRLRPLSARTTSAVVVRPIQAQVMGAEMPSGHPYIWIASIAVECYARSGPSASPDVAIDDLLSSVYGRLMADPTLGGAVLALQPQAVHYEFDGDGESTVCATLQLNARLRSVGANF